MENYQNQGGLIGREFGHSFWKRKVVAVKYIYYTHIQWQGNIFTPIKGDVAAGEKQIYRYTQKLAKNQTGKGIRQKP